MLLMKRTRRTSLFSILLASMVILMAQRDSANEGRKESFTSPDNAFRFDYPVSLVRCERKATQLHWWEPAESCEAFTPVCSDFSGQSSGTVACIAYPAAGMKGTNFQAAAFSVSQRKAATTQECLNVEEPPPHVGRERRETVNGTIFTVIKTDGVETGNLLDGYVYRGFHKNWCYELDIRIATSNPGYADPGTMKGFDLEMVHRRLKQVLDTFKFIE